MPGCLLEAYSEKYDKVALRVQEVLHFSDFDGAYANLGQKLVPEGASTPKEALQLYRRWNPEEAVLTAGGVVAVEVSVEGIECKSQPTVSQHAA